MTKTADLTKVVIQDILTTIPRIVNEVIHVLVQVHKKYYFLQHLRSYYSNATQTCNKK